MLRVQEGSHTHTHARTLCRHLEKGNACLPPSHTLGSQSRCREGHGRRLESRKVAVAGPPPGPRVQQVVAFGAGKRFCAFPRAGDCAWSEAAFPFSLTSQGGGRLRLKAGFRSTSATTLVQRSDSSLERILPLLFSVVLPSHPLDALLSIGDTTGTPLDQSHKAASVSEKARLTRVATRRTLSVSLGS